MRPFVGCKRMIIKRWGFLGLGVYLETPSPEMRSEERRAFHAHWMAEFRWNHALRHWLFGGSRPLPLGPNDEWRSHFHPALWRRISKDIYWWLHRATNSEVWREYWKWHMSLPKAPEPDESSVVFLDRDDKWQLVGKITKEKVLKWTK